MGLQQAQIPICQPALLSITLTRPLLRHPAWASCKGIPQRTALLPGQLTSWMSHHGLV